MKKDANGAWSLAQHLASPFNQHRSNQMFTVFPDGSLFITGHDAPTLFVLQFPKMGAVMELVDTIPISAQGQAFAFDPTDGNVLYSISRKTQEVIVSRITKREPAKVGDATRSVSPTGRDRPR